MAIDTLDAKKAVGALLILVLAAILAVAVGSGIYLAKHGKGAEKPSPTTKPSISQGPYISNVEIEKFLYENDELYMRLKITGYANLTDNININGVYGSWFGRVTVKLPDGSEAELLHSGDHTTVFTQFSEIPRTLTIYAFLPTEWYEQHNLEGEYNISVWLQGPYENRTSLFEKSFDLTISLEVKISPTSWNSWEEPITLTITNKGSLPVVWDGSVSLQKAGIDIGSISAQKEGARIVIMPGETKRITATATISEIHKKDLGGQTLPIDFIIFIVGKAQPAKITETISFP
jgi:hypothetical protein